MHKHNKHLLTFPKTEKKFQIKFVVDLFERLLDAQHKHRVSHTHKQAHDKLLIDNLVCKRFRDVAVVNGVLNVTDSQRRDFTTHRAEGWAWKEQTTDRPSSGRNKPPQ